MFAKRLSDISGSIARKDVRLIQYGGTTRADIVVNRYDEIMGYSSGFEGLMTYLNSLLPKNEHIGQARWTETTLYPEIALRELVTNAIIHQDMTVTGAGPQIEVFSDRIEITNLENRWSTPTVFWTCHPDHVMKHWHRPCAGWVSARSKVPGSITCFLLLRPIKCPRRVFAMRRTR